MKVVELTRDCMNAFGTLGRIKVDGEFICYSVERPWVDNERGVSCIPVGAYDLELCATGRTMPDDFKGDSYEVKNVPGRSQIKIHVANRPDQLEGCIAPNMSKDSETMTGGKSKTATFKFMMAMKEDEDLVYSAKIIIKED